jgi:hypothetical protein
MKHWSLVHDGDLDEARLASSKAKAEGEQDNADFRLRQ